MSKDTETKFYSFEEIKKNNGKDTDRTWIVVKDNVYDVTDYLDDHPGGGELVTEWAGMDATKAFDDAGHSNDATKELKQYKIGEVVEEERKKKGKKNGVDKKEAKNGPKVVEDKESRTINRSCISIVTCGLCG